MGSLSRISDRALYAGLGCAVIVIYGVILAVSLNAAHRNGASTERFIAPSGYSQAYVGIARTIVSDHRYAASPDAPLDTFRNPGYPVFLALLLGIFQAPLMIPIAQILLAAGSAILIWRLGERHLSRMSGLIAAALFALDPAAVIYTLTAFTESLSVFVLLLAAWLLTKREVDARRALAGGALLGYLVLIRTTGLLAIPFLLAWLVYDRWNDIRKALIPGIACLVGVCLVVIPWMLRNHQAAGHFSISSIGSYNMLFYNVLEFETVRTGDTRAEIRAQMYERLGPDATDQSVSTFALSDAENTLAREYITAHPASYLAFHTIKTVPFFIGSSIAAAQYALHMSAVTTGDLAPDTNLSALLFSGRISEALNALGQNPIPAIEQMLWASALGAALLGIVAAYARRSIVLAPLILFAAIIGATAFITGPVSMPRYRIVVEPLMFLMLIEGVRQIALWLREGEGAKPRFVRESGRYAVAGILAFAVDTAFLIFCTEKLGIPYLISGVIGFCAGLVVIYELSTRWVFEEGSRIVDTRAAFLVFGLIGVGGLIINEALLWLFTDAFGLYYVLSKLCAGCIAVVWNFGLRKYLIFRA